MMVRELIARLQALPQDAVVVRMTGGRDEYVETGDRMEVIDVAQALDTRHEDRWWAGTAHERNTPELYRTREAVIL